VAVAAAGALRERTVQKIAEIRRIINYLRGGGIADGTNNALRRVAGEFVGTSALLRAAVAHFATQIKKLVACGGNPAVVAHFGKL